MEVIKIKIETTHNLILKTAEEVFDQFTKSLIESSNNKDEIAIS